MGTFTAIFLIQYYCLHGILPFSKSCPEVDQPQSAGEESLLTRDITLSFMQHCAIFPLKLKSTNVFPKNILKSKACDKSIPARKKFFCHVIVKNYLCKVLPKFLIKFEST